MSGEGVFRFVAISFTFLGGLVAPALPAAAPKADITNIRGQAKGREARVSFTLRKAFSPEMVEALKSGIEISFKTIVRVQRVHRNWFDPTVGEVTFSRSVRYDSLSRVYLLNRGKGEESVPDIFAALSGMPQHEVIVPLDFEIERGKKYRAWGRGRADQAGGAAAR